jgi:hypothetical protein
MDNLAVPEQSVRHDDAHPREQLPGMEVSPIRCGPPERLYHVRIVIKIDDDDDPRTHGYDPK